MHAYSRARRFANLQAFLRLPSIGPSLKTKYPFPLEFLLHTLISFLGSSRFDPATGYRKARYRFDDGQVAETPFISLALAQQLQPDRVLILGTRGSMWPALIEHGLEGSVAAEDLRLRLMEASEQQAVTQADLDALAQLARESLGREVSLHLIPYADSADGQREILDLIAREVTRGRVSFDVTHGFRHLAMLGMLSAFMLSHARNLEVEGLWYGALDMTDRDSGLTPVVRLDGMLATERWLSALVRFDASGDFSVFAPLLEADGLKANEAKRLTRAWGLLMQNNVADAVRELQPLQRRLQTPLGGTSELFRETLRKRLRWCEARDLGEQQRLLALQALDRGDLLRASLLGFEAFLSRQVLEQGGNPASHGDKERAQKAFREELHAGDHADWKKDAFHLLNNVRNACAHGTRPMNPKHQKLLKNPELLAKSLEQALGRLNTP